MNIYYRIQYLLAKYEVVSRQNTRQSYIDDFYEDVLPSHTSVPSTT